MKFSDLIRAAGWCCPYAFLEANRKVRTGLVAARLGVSESTVIEWRRYHAQKARVAVCQDTKSCFLARGVDLSPRGNNSAAALEAPQPTKPEHPKEDRH